MKSVWTATEFLETEWEKPVFGLIGSKVESSLSKFLHEKLFRAAGREERYLLLKLRGEEIGPVLRSGNLLGCNVTVPFKREVMPFLDELDPLAQRIGSVNTVVRRGGRLIGYNTDCDGVLSTLRRLNVSPEGSRVLLLGTGGAARTVAFCLSEGGAAVSVASRELARAEEFCRSFPGAEGKMQPICYDEIAGDYDLVVNATPVGMFPGEGETPLDLSRIRTGAAFDLVYNPLMTAFLRSAGPGVRIANGLCMLVEQAIRAEEHFFGAPLDRAGLGRVEAELAADLLFKRLSDRYGVRSIALCGFMGCGKSTVGTILADRAGVPLIDTDLEIERAAGKTVAEIFREEGETGFRARERETIARLPKDRPCVISLGGGSVFSEQNVRNLRERARIVFLDVPLAEIRRRVADPATRPLFSRNETELQTLYETRKGGYAACADLTVSEGSSQEAAERICLWI